MAAPPAAQLADDNRGQSLAAWAARLATDFARVAIFQVHGTQADMASCQGFSPPSAPPTISLVAQTPLRFCIEAAGPVIGAGRAHGGASVAALFGSPAPRAYAVLPRLAGAQLEALAYVDHGGAPLPPLALARWLGAAAPRPMERRHRRARLPRLAPACGRPSTAGTRPDSPANGRPAPLHAGLTGPTAALAATALSPPAAAAASMAPFGGESEAVWPLHPWPAATVGPPAGRAPRRLRHLWPGLAGFALVMVAVAAALGWATMPPRTALQTLAFDVPERAQLAQVADRLVDAGAIRAAKPFLWLSRALRVDRHMRAGTYTMPAGLWLWQVVEVLHRGQVQTVTVTIPEGLTLHETANLLARQHIVAAPAFVAAAHDPHLLRHFAIDGPSAEGFLFPETYRVVRGASARDVVATMVQQFYRRVRRQQAAAHLPPLSRQALYDRVILASLVERETRHPVELPRIAGVFENRLDRHLRLESCASVQYVLGRPKARLQLDDIRQPSPYNTYLHPGLPPGPIASPGLAALTAALRPERHDFLFFLAREDGSQQHHFSRTFAEHERTRRKLSHLGPLSP